MDWLPTSEEIELTIKQSNIRRALGLDGLPIEVQKEKSEYIKNVVFNFITK